jgi:hypothetical protein
MRYLILSILFSLTFLAAMQYGEARAQRSSVDMLDVRAKKQAILEHVNRASKTLEADFLRWNRDVDLGRIGGEVDDFVPHPTNFPSPSRKDRPHGSATIWIDANLEGGTHSPALSLILPVMHSEGSTSSPVSPIHMKPGQLKLPLPQAFPGAEVFATASPIAVHHTRVPITVAHHASVPTTSSVAPTAIPSLRTVQPSQSSDPSVPGWNTRFTAPPKWLEFFASHRSSSRISSDTVALSPSPAAPATLPSSDAQASGSSQSDHSGNKSEVEQSVAPIADSYAANAKPQAARRTFPPLKSGVHARESHATAAPSGMPPKHHHAPFYFLEKEHALCVHSKVLGNVADVDSCARRAAATKGCFSQFMFSQEHLSCKSSVLSVEGKVMEVSCPTARCACNDYWEIGGREVYTEDDCQSVHNGAFSIYKLGSASGRLIVSIWTIVLTSSAVCSYVLYT